MSGTTVLRSAVEKTGTAVIDISSLPPGMYYVSVAGNSATTIQQFVKQ